MWCWEIGELPPDDDPPEMCRTRCPKCGAEFEAHHTVNFTDCPTETCTAVFDPGDPEDRFGRMAEGW